MPDRSSGKIALLPEIRLDSTGRLRIPPQRGIVRRILALIFGGLLAGCACGQMGQPVCPSLQVTSNPNFLTISGSSFSNIPNCAHLSMSGLPPPEAVVAIGDPQCNNGSFQNFNWQYSYVGCSPSTTQSVVVAGIDNQTSTAASQTVSIGWGPNCGLSGFCGQIGQAACPSGCVSGVNSGGTCVACGGEGQPVCAGNTCQKGPPDLNPNFANGNLVCTTSCGHTQGYTPCNASMGPCGGAPPTLEIPQSPCVTKNGNLNDYICFDGAMIDMFGNCTCVPNTLNSCQVHTSVPKPPANDTGTCSPGQFLNC
jgi:hypothetical protein